jgi:hypothetical protein
LVQSGERVARGNMYHRRRAMLLNGVLGDPERKKMQEG